MYLKRSFWLIFSIKFYICISNERIMRKWRPSTSMQRMNAHSREKCCGNFNNLLVFSALKDYISFNFIWLGLSIKNQEKRYFEVSLLIIFSNLDLSALTMIIFLRFLSNNQYHPIIMGKYYMLYYSSCTQFDVREGRLGK